MKKPFKPLIERIDPTDIGEQLRAFKRTIEDAIEEQRWKHKQRQDDVDENDPLSILIQMEESDDTDSDTTEENRHMNDTNVNITNKEPKVNTRLESLRSSLLAARKDIQVLEAKRTELEKQLVRAKAKAKILKNDEDVKIVEDALADIMADLAEMTDVHHTAEVAFNAELERDLRDSMLERSEEYNFGIPVNAALGSDERTVTDYALLRCNLLSAIARALQDTIVIGEDYFLRELARAYGDPNGETSQTGTKPAELEGRAALRVEQLKSFREFVTTLRFTVERQFEEALDDVPESSIIRPRMLWQTDDEAKTRYDERRAQRAEAARVNATTVMNTELRYAQMGSSAYKPSSRVL